MKFTDGVNWFLYDGILQSVGIGTSLCYRRDWWLNHKFKEMQIGEDSEFIRTARSVGRYIAAPACGLNPVTGIEDADLMYATIHAGNTSPRDLAGYKKL